MKYRKGSFSVMVPFHGELKPGTAHTILKDIATQNTISVTKLISDYSLKL